MTFVLLIGYAHCAIVSPQPLICQYPASFLRLADPSANKATMVGQQTRRTRSAHKTTWRCHPLRRLQLRKPLCLCEPVGIDQQRNPIAFFPTLVLEYFAESQIGRSENKVSDNEVACVFLLRITGLLLLALHLACNNRALRLVYQYRRGCRLEKDCGDGLESHAGASSRSTQACHNQMQRNRGFLS